MSGGKLGGSYGGTGGGSICDRDSAVRRFGSIDSGGIREMGGLLAPSIPPPDPSPSGEYIYISYPLLYISYIGVYFLLFFPACWVSRIMFVYFKNGYMIGIHIHYTPYT